MKMTVGQLIEALQDYPEEYEVRLAMQPSYPLQYEIKDLVSSDELGLGQEEESDEEGEGEESGAPQDPNANIVWIKEAGQVYAAPYCPRVIFQN